MMNIVNRNAFRFALSVSIFSAMTGAATGAAYAQIEGPKRGIAPIASNGDFEVTGIKVNTTGKDPDEARKKGWEEAQRLGWVKLYEQTHGRKTSALSDGTLNGIVANVIVEEEQIGPKRYIATLGVSFDRARAGQLLGVRGIGRKSAPMLVVPIMISGGSFMVYERQTAWQNAWAKFRTAESSIDYVRPSGAGSESLLLNGGQLERRSRNWWRVILDQFGAADVIYPIVKLERQWPGGPVLGRFTARYGPDNRYIGSFSLRADSADDIPKMMNEGIVKIDQLFQSAFKSGRLRSEVRLLLEDTIDAEDLEKLEREADAALRAAAARKDDSPSSQDSSGDTQSDNDEDQDEDPGRTNPQRPDIGTKPKEPDDPDQGRPILSVEKVIADTPTKE